MATFTGILGTRYSQPGNIVLGTVPAGNASNAAATITVATTIDVAIDQGKWKRLTDAITVATTQLGPRTTVLPVTSTIAVTPTLPTPVRIDVRKVTSSIVVTPSLTRAGDNNQTVTSSIIVTPALVSRDTINRQTVTSSLTVAPAIVAKGDRTRVVTSSVAVAASIAERDAVDHLAVTSSVTVTPTITPAIEHGRQVSQSVTSTIGVSPTATGRNNTVRISVLTSISISTPESDSVPVHHQSTTDTIHVTGTVGIVSPVNSQSVTHTITVGTVFPNPVQFRIDPNRIELAHFLTVSDAVAGGAPSRVLGVTDAISVAGSIAVRQLKFQVTHSISVGTAITGGGSSRVDTITDTIAVIDAVSGRSDTIRLSIEDDIAVFPIRILETSGHVALAVNQAILLVTTVTTRATNHQSVSDGIMLSGAVGVRVPVNRQYLTQAIAVGQAIHSSPNRQAVTSAVTVGWRLAQFEIDVFSRVHVTSTLRRDHDRSLTDSLPISQTVQGPIRRSRHLTDTLPIADRCVRGAVWVRSLTDTLKIPDGLYPRFLDIAGTVINVNAAVGTLVTQNLTLQSKDKIIILPAPQLGDGKDNVATTTIQRSMNAKTVVFKQSSTRQKLKYLFRLDKIKAFELRAFLQANLSELLTLTTWDAQIWMVYLTSDPFELQYAGRSAGADEFSTIELTFEGTKLSG